MGHAGDRGAVGGGGRIVTGYPSPIITDRWADWERRLARVEALVGGAVIGTDQTIKGSHDRLDTLLGAGGAGLSQCRVASFVKTGISDNTATAVFTITTTNETGSADGGAWVAHIFALASVDATSVATAAAVKGAQGTIQHSINDAGSAATTVDQWHSGTNAPTHAGIVDVGTVTITATDTSAYTVTVNITIDATGVFGAVIGCQCVMMVVLEWTGFTTAPVMAAA